MVNIWKKILKKIALYIEFIQKVQNSHLTCISRFVLLNSQNTGQANKIPILLTFDPIDSHIPVLNLELQRTVSR